MILKKHKIITPLKYRNASFSLLSRKDFKIRYSVADFPGMNMDSRKRIISGTKRVVLKVGSRLLVNDSNFPCIEKIKSLVSQIHALRESGLEVILVSSGAVSAGMAVLGWEKRPKDLPDLQAAAATAGYDS